MAKSWTDLWWQKPIKMRHNRVEENHMAGKNLFVSCKYRPIDANARISILIDAFSYFRGISGHRGQKSRPST